MLQELTAQTGAVLWAVGSMFFFLAAWVVIVIWVIRRPREEMDERAWLPLEGDEAKDSGVRSQDSGVRSQDSGFRSQESGDPGDRARGRGTAPTPES